MTDTDPEDRDANDARTPTSPDGGSTADGSGDRVQHPPVDIDSEAWPEPGDPGRIQWDLQADDSDVLQLQSLTLINGRESGFEDVKNGPAVYIGRENPHYDLDESRLANPYSTDDYGRLEAVRKYTSWLVDEIRSESSFAANVYKIHRRPVACWCAPELCHGHALNLYLSLTVEAGITDLDQVESMINEQITAWVERRIERGDISPSDYYD